MSNHVDERALALYSRCDLSGSEERAVKEHVENCAECQQLLNDFERSQELLETFSTDPTPEQLSEVREAVLLRVASRNSFDAAWKWWLAAAAAVALMVVLHLHHSPSVYTPGSPLVAPSYVPETPIAAAPQPIPVRRKAHRPRTAGLRSIQLIAKDDEGSLIRMTTADPNVVILLETERTPNYE